MTHSQENKACQASNLKDPRCLTEHTKRVLNDVTTVHNQRMLDLFTKASNLSIRQETIKENQRKFLELDDIIDKVQ